MTPLTLALPPGERGVYFFGLMTNTPSRRVSRTDLSTRALTAPACGPDISYCLGGVAVGLAGGDVTVSGPHPVEDAEAFLHEGLITVEVDYGNHRLASLLDDDGVFPPSDQSEERFKSALSLPCAECFDHDIFLS